MCGRFSLTDSGEEFLAQFGLVPVVDFTLPQYNIAPTQDVLGILHQDTVRAEAMRWGFVPPWAKNANIGSGLINARAETLAEKPAFRRAFSSQRCIIVADGFFEWKRTPGGKVPFYIRLRSGRVFGFAGLWADCQSAQGRTVRTCTIVTTSPNSLVESFHNRMPVILSQDVLDLWLDPDIEDTDLLATLLQPYPCRDMEAYPVSTVVNSPRNDLPACVEPVEGEASQGTLEIGNQGDQSQMQLFED